MLANSQEELDGTLEEIGRDGEGYSVTGPGVHDEQLTAEMHFALRSVELAQRLECMAEARGRPRPGQPHPEAEVEDPDGVQGGARASNDVEFEEEGALPGGELSGEEGAVDGAHADGDVLYRNPAWQVNDDQVQDVVHRESDAQYWIKSKHAHGKRDLMQQFLRHNKEAYASLQERRSIAKVAPLLRRHNRSEWKAAKARQDALGEARKTATGHRPEDEATAGAAAASLDREALARLLGADELPQSPLEAAAELIATSGVWRSKEQYGASLPMLSPCETGGAPIEPLIF